MNKKYVQTLILASFITGVSPYIKGQSIANSITVQQIILDLNNDGIMDRVYIEEDKDDISESQITKHQGYSEIINRAAYLHCVISNSISLKTGNIGGENIYETWKLESSKDDPAMFSLIFCSNGMGTRILTYNFKYNNQTENISLESIEQQRSIGGERVSYERSVIGNDIDLSTLNREVIARGLNYYESAPSNSFAEMEMPSYPGGISEMMKFISSNLTYPENARKNKIQGKITIRYKVEKNGEISNAEIVKGIDPECDAEALRVISIMPNWNPGKMSEEDADIWFTVPITFRLND